MTVKLPLSNIKSSISHAIKMVNLRFLDKTFTRSAVNLNELGYKKNSSGYINNCVEWICGIYYE